MKGLVTRGNEARKRQIDGEALERQGRNERPSEGQHAFGVQLIVLPVQHGHGLTLLNKDGCPRVRQGALPCSFHFFSFCCLAFSCSISHASLLPDLIYPLESATVSHLPCAREHGALYPTGHLSHLSLERRLSTHAFPSRLSVSLASVVQASPSKSPSHNLSPDMRDGMVFHERAYNRAEIVRLSKGLHSASSTSQQHEERIRVRQAKAGLAVDERNCLRLLKDEVYDLKAAARKAAEDIAKTAEDIAKAAEDIAKTAEDIAKAAEDIA